MEEIKCSSCGEKQIWKARKPRGKQQYQCKKCRRKFIKELNYSEEFKREAIKIFYEGNSGRAVGRLMGINKSTVYNRIKILNKKIVEQKTSPKKEETKKIIEMDELYSYITHKKTEFT